MPVMSALRPLVSAPAKVPLHGLAQPALEILRWPPAELARDLGGIDRVAPVVSGPVGHEADQLLVAARRARPHLVEQRAEPLHQLQVVLLAARADVVGLAGAALLEHRPEGR